MAAGCNFLQFLSHSGLSWALLGTSRASLGPLWREFLINLGISEGPLWNHVGCCAPLCVADHLVCSLQPWSYPLIGVRRPPARSASSISAAPLVGAQACGTFLHVLLNVPFFKNGYMHFLRMYTCMYPFCTPPNPPTGPADC